MSKIDSDENELEAYQSNFEWWHSFIVLCGIGVVFMVLSTVFV